MFLRILNKIVKRKGFSVIILYDRLKRKCKNKLRSRKIVGKKCPNCGFKYNDDLDSCPKCGFDLKNQSNEEKIIEEQNDDIKWSEYGDVPLESVMEMFNENDAEEKMAESEKSAISADSEDELSEPGVSEEESNASSEEDEQPAENSLLAAYIREHREDSEISESDVENAEVITEESDTSNQEDEDSHDVPSESDLQGSDSDEFQEDLSVKEETVSADQEEKNTQAVNKETDELIAGKPKVTDPLPIFGEAPKESDSNKVLLDEVELLDSDADKSTSEPTFEKSEIKPEASNKKKTIARGITAVAVLILGASAWSVYSQNKKENDAQQVEETKKKATELESIQKSLDAFYTDDTHEFIRVEKVGGDLTKLSTQLDALKDQKGYEKVSTTFTDVSNKVSMIQKTNELFTEPVISDNTLVKNPLLKVDKKIDLEPMKEDTAFAKLINEAISVAHTQFDELQAAKGLVDVVYLDGKVTDKANKENYDAAKKAVEKVKNTELTKELTKGLEAVKKQLDAQENKAKEEAQKVEAEKQAEEAAAVEQTNAAESNTVSDTQSDSTSSNASDVSGVEWAYDSKGMRHPAFQKNNQGLPILSSRQSDIDDVNNAAWTWAPGVKENVLSIAFDRGYIVEGGYYLEPVRIEDGEGFYNLYATSPSNLLGSEYSFPFYLMTINCKTGWFGGNGSDQTQ